MADDQVRRAVLRAAEELGGVARAGGVAKRAVELLEAENKAVTYRHVKSGIWQMVDERELDWTPDRKIAPRETAQPLLS